MRLLEKYHVEQTFFDGAQLNHFITNNSAGRIFGLTLSYTTQQLLISKGLLVVRGYRVSFANEVLMTFDAYPAQTETQNLILRITVTQDDSSATITTGAITYMDDIQTGVGTYDYLLATFIIGQTGIREITPQIRDIKKGSGGSGIGTVIDSVNMTEQALVTLMLTLNDDIYVINTQLYGDEFLFVQKNGQQIGRYAGTGQSFLWDMTNSGWVLASGGDSGGGTHWVSGTLITGTGSNILCYDMALYGQVRVGDIYRNNDTQNTYTCTYKDNEKTAWKYESSIRGLTGDAGASVQTALINESGNLIISLTNGATQNAGSVWVGGIANYSRGLTDQYNNNITTDDLLVDESGTHLPIVKKAQADKNGNDIDTTYQKNPLTFSDISAAAWVADTTYTGFGYACTLSLTGVTADMYATVIFGVDDAVSGNYAPVCLTGAGTVKVYAKVSTSITIPTIRAEV